MIDETAPPKTAREALMIELLSDLGRVHDDIKAIPELLKLSISDSLEIIAIAVADAESTAQKLQDATKEAIQTTATRVAFEAGSELSGAIHVSLERTFDPALHKASIKVEELERRVKGISANVRDTHATRMNYIILVGFVFAMMLTLGGVTWLTIISKQNDETNKWFYEEYKAQREIINSLPADVKKKFGKHR
ncbi:hypothetical protein JH25_27925 [Pseudomonas sp. BRG-100]|uniref:hypothetical protein n=1 Tax=Pseudomonas sp. BRG-100 TaxID=1524267 RepID=UPI0004E6486B|nr:hypothetical protein [Pseudomonas sp. BRG-100]KFF42197.1 hypothetical protein JH25_27925 [Pseudomonas sp. BRG-100]